MISSARWHYDGNTLRSHEPDPARPTTQRRSRPGEPQRFYTAIDFIMKFLTDSDVVLQPSP